VNALRSAIVRGARRTMACGEVPRGTRPGDGFAFDRLRGYVDGDDPRRIDWSATARIGALQTRVYLEETILVLAALVDESPSMRLGRRRALADAAHEATVAWFGAAQSADRARRIVDERLVGDRRAAVDVRARAPFDLRRSLELAVRALAAGTSFLLVTDGLDLVAYRGSDDDLLARLGRRFDATVLLAADPWIDGLPLRGFVRVRDAESGRVRRLFIGRKTRDRYVHASRERDATMRERFRRARWRVGTLDEADGAASLARTFGVT
jgi:uncharacterized protein (DUF58 family)